MDTNRLNHITIQRYFDGQLDEKSMHDLEKQALEDPFLADALDGYARTDVPVGKHISLLQAQLEARIALQQESRNVFNFSWQRLSIAAAASLLFVSASILFWMKFERTDRQLVTKTRQVDVNLSSTDSIQHSQTSKKEAVISGNGVSAKAETVTSQHTENTSDILIAANEMGYKNVEIADTSGQAIDEKNSPVPSRHIVEPKDLQELAAVSIDQALQGRIAGLDSVSVRGRQLTALGTRANSMSAKQMASPVSQFSIPSVGWENFNSYLRENTIFPIERTNGEVIVAFSINRNGEPENFKIKTGLNPQSDLEAIRLIKNGPKWVPGKDSTAIVTILFNK